MTQSDNQTAGARLRRAFELHDTGVQLMRQNLRRRFADASETEIDEKLAAWLRARPGAEYGDAEGIGQKIERAE